jgi:hypothetical protein
MYYKMQVATDVEFQLIVYSALVTNGNEMAVFDHLDYYTTYYWRVKTINEITGAESEWSDYCVFRTEGADIVGLHTTTNTYYISVNNWNRERGSKCHLIGFDLNNLRDDVNYPITSGTCNFIGFALSALSGRNV